MTVRIVRKFAIPKGFTGLLSSIRIMALVVSLAAYSGLKCQTTDDFLVSTVGTRPSLTVFPSGNVGTVWTNDYTYFRGFDSLGNPLGDSVRVSATPLTEGPRIAAGFNFSIAVWRNVSFTSNSYVKGRLITFIGDTLGMEEQINDTYFDAERAAAKVCLLNDSTFFVAWIGNGPQTPSPYDGVYGQFVSDSLKQIGSDILLSGDTVLTSGKSSLAVASSLSSKTLVVAWLSSSSSGNHIIYRILSKNGSPITPNIAFIDTAFTFFWSPSVAMDSSGSFSIAWSARRGDNTWGVYMLQLDVDGMPVADPVLISDDRIAYASEVRLDGEVVDKAFIVWEIEAGGTYHVQGKRIENGICSSPNFFLSSFSDSTQQTYPEVVLKNDRVYLVWQSGSSLIGRFIDFHDNSVRVIDETRGLEPAFELLQNYPNPFNPSTTINLSLSEKTFADLKIFDSLGRELITLFSGDLPSGTKTFRWDGTVRGVVLPSGVYYCRLSTKGRSQAKKMLLLR